MFIQTDNFGYKDSFRCRMHYDRYDYPVHIHQHAEIAVVLRGEIEISDGKSKEHAEAGTIALIPPFLAHGFSTPSECDVWIAVISPSFFAEAAKEIALCERFVFTPSDETLSYVSSKLIFPKERSFCSIRAGILAICDEYITSMPRSDRRKEKSFLPKLFLYLEEHYKEDLSLPAVASALGYSASYISHALSDIPGMSFAFTLSSIRIEAAKKLLSDTDKPVNEIALECGFGCERSFHRAFAKLVGIAPGQYRISKRA